MRHYLLFLCFLTSPAWSVDSISLLYTKQYQSLNRYLEGVFLQHTNGALSEQKLGQALAPFATSDLELNAMFEGWLAAMPNTWQPHLAAGIYYQHLAWLSRGAKYASNTSKQQLKAMKSYRAKAIAHLTRASVIEPKLAHAWAYLINLTKLMGGAEDIERLYQQANLYVPSSFILHWNYANARTPKWGGKMQEVLLFSQQMEQASKQWPHLRVFTGYPDYVLADIARRKNNDEKRALDHIEKALSYGETMGYLNLKGRILTRLEAYSEAEVAYQRTLQLDPNYSPALVGLAWMYFNTDQYERGLEYANQALALEPLSPDALEIRARIFSRMKMPDRALADLTLFTQYGVMSHSLYRLQGYLLFYNKKDYQSAAVVYDYAAQLKPKDERAWYYLMASRYMLKDCRYVDAAERFLALCERGAECEPRDLSWSKQNLTCAF
ncbi:DUF4034 domain-containing protein [Motilimonas cestriensis]|uniref:DUF4034 domain-containing protein n=1 Tax=Motilimonas cestriensis TaxID=2742685 RepID=UPI003DA5DB34